MKSAYLVNDFGADPNTGKGGGLDNSANLGNGDLVSLSQSLSRGLHEGDLVGDSRRVGLHDRLCLQLRLKH